MSMARMVATGMLLCRIVPVYSQPLPGNILSGEMPQYPALARAEHIQGSVKLQFGLTESGEAFDVEVVSGHPLLANAAVNAVKTWRFSSGAGEYQPGRKYETTFEFTVSDIVGQPPNNTFQATVESQSYRLQTTTPGMSEIRADQCPTVEKLPPPHGNKLDFVELSRSACYGSCPVYTVRVFRDGSVEWHGNRFVKTLGDSRTMVDPKRAEQIVERVRSEKFWSLCGRYSLSITDLASFTLTANVNGEEKAVVDYGDSGSAWLEELADAVDDIADTHQWRHGDPRTEPLSNILADARRAKPGITLLMRAAGTRDLQRIRDLLENDADVSAEDSSGWTALMYAAGSWSADPAKIRILLDARADPNHASGVGDTALMACAVTGRFSEDLVKAGSSINHQDKSGVSALMILATRAHPDEIAAALRAGANASLRDVEGRTALDYLNAADCRKDPLRNERNESKAIVSPKCDVLDKDGFRESAQILREAMRASR